MQECLTDLGKLSQPATDSEKADNSGNWVTQDISNPPQPLRMQLYKSANFYASRVAECSGESLVSDCG